MMRRILPWSQSTKTLVSSTVSPEIWVWSCSIFLALRQQRRAEKGRASGRDGKRICGGRKGNWRGSGCFGKVEELGGGGWGLSNVVAAIVTVAVGCSCYNGWLLDWNWHWFLLVSVGVKRQGFNSQWWTQIVDDFNELTAFDNELLLFRDLFID